MKLYYVPTCKSQMAACGDVGEFRMGSARWHGVVRSYVELATVRVGVRVGIRVRVAVRCGVAWS